MKKVTVSDVTFNLDKRRVPVSEAERARLAKVYPYYGAQGIVDHIDGFLFDGDYLLVAEDGENLRSQKSNVCTFATGKFWVNNHAHILEAKPGNSLRYIFYRLGLVDFRPFVTGSAQPKLTQDALSAIPITVHEEREQELIAGLLSALDAKITLNQRMNAELEAIAKLLFDYWFVQFDFPISKDVAARMRRPELEGKPYRSSGGSMVHSPELNREVPKGWEARTLSSIVDVSREALDPSSNPAKAYRHFSIPAFDANGAYFLEAGSTIKSSKFIVRELDILVSKLNPRYNRVVYSEPYDDAIASSEFVIWRTTAQQMKNYLFMVAKSSSFISHCSQSAGGTSNSHKRVEPDVMMRFQVPFDQNQVELFGDLVDRTLQLLLANRKQNLELATLRDWLLPMLMNGQARISEGMAG